MKQTKSWNIKPARLLMACMALLTLLVLAAVFVSSQVNATAGIRKTINFQGKVVNTDGTNVTDGSYTFIFRFYTGSSGGGGGSCVSSCVWEETKTLATTNGIFQTELGDTTALPGSVDFNSDNIYLSVAFNGDTEMSPRVRLTAAPYAFNADKLGGLDSSAFVKLSPGSQQTGMINVSGNIQSGGTLQANTLDAASSGALTLGSTNATSIALAKNTTMASGLTLSLQGNNALNLGSTTAAGGIVLKDGTSNNRSVTLTTPGLSASYTLTLPTALGASGDCLKDSTGSGALAFGACGTGGGGGGSGTLQNGYDNSGTADPQIQLSSTNGGLKLRDASTPLSSAFSVANNGGTYSYFSVASTGLNLQRAASTTALSFGFTDGILRVYDSGASGNYAGISYSSSTAIFAASSGITQLGNGNGNVTIALTGQNDALNFSKTYTPSGTYSNNDFTVTRTLTGGSNSLGGSVVKIEDNSTGSVSAPSVLLVSQGNASATGNLIQAQQNGTSKFSVNTSGQVTLSGGVTAAASTALNLTGNAASTLSTSAGALTITSAAAATWSTTTGTLTVQAGGANKVVTKPGTDSSSSFEIQNSAGSALLVADASGLAIKIGGGDVSAASTVTLLVVDNKSDAGDPASTINGSIYYNQISKKMRCYVGSAWQECLSAMTKRVTADQSSTSTTLADITDLTFPVLASTDYDLRCNLIYQTAATTTGIKISLNGPTSPTMVAATFTTPRIATSTTGVSNITALIIRAYDGGGATDNADTATSNIASTLNGVFRNGTTAGTLAVRLASEVAASSATIKAGSYCQVTPIN